MNLKAHPRILIIPFLLALLCCKVAGQVVGNTVRLSATNPQGVPVHPAAGDASYVRWSNGTIGKVAAIDAPTGWLKIDAAGKLGWVTKAYLTVVTDDSDGDGPDSPDNEVLTCVVGTWNLEWLKDGAQRGFPEYDPTRYHPPGAKYSQRTTEDYQLIAGIISTQLFAKILVLNEINGAGNNSSVELDRLKGFLGNGWEYDIANSGVSQRIALLYDTKAVRKDTVVEFTIPRTEVGGSDIFARDPFLGKFTLLDRQGTPKNDLIVVGIHLASGQQEVANHNEAMVVLNTRLRQALQNGTFPAGERDVLILGDFNANRYDLGSVENFWTGYDNAGFKFQTLGPIDVDDYSPTRLAGSPLIPTSRIDYILGSARTGGIVDELVQLTAQVHVELTKGNYDNFREHVSDHLPVTVRVQVVADDD